MQSLKKNQFISNKAANDQIPLTFQHDTFLGAIVNIKINTTMYTDDVGRSETATFLLEEYQDRTRLPKNL